MAIGSPNILYVTASLNQYVSNIDHEIWRKSGTNTNIAEAAHVMVNKEGKQLSLLAAILRGKRYDERCYKTIDIHDKTGVPRTHQDKSEVKRMQISIKRKESHTRKYKRQEDSASENEETILSMTDHGKMLELDIEERKMRLREREIKARTAEAEARLIEAKAEELELENQRKKYENEMDK
ncbi:3354_t:CDS:2 [Funneliformis mosseae]|uniref:3354_t:CDS:1 n=1 Tax=Funneliformis mosseae TaxID=27381 RepID=A0A9N9DMH3_FUNMO|nr:3354_t:CDS:2 [Funneliformis mosseae]